MTTQKYTLRRSSCKKASLRPFLWRKGCYNGQRGDFLHSFPSRDLLTHRLSDPRTLGDYPGLPAAVLRGFGNHPVFLARKKLQGCSREFHCILLGAGENNHWFLERIHTNIVLETKQAYYDSNINNLCKIFGNLLYPIDIWILLNRLM